MCPPLPFDASKPRQGGPVVVDAMRRRCSWSEDGGRVLLKGPGLMKREAPGGISAPGGLSSCDYEYGTLLEVVRQQHI